MTGGSAQDASGTQSSRNPESEGGGSKRRARSKKSGAVPDGGKIVPPGSSLVQTIVAVAFLIFVALVAFGTVLFIGELTRGNRLTYWMIELIFALLCGGAGALVGGSAVVRSTLRIPGSPVHATLGGAISMVIVGFAVAYLGEPPDEVAMYALEIHKVPDRQTVGNDEYRVFVGAITPKLSFSRDSNNVSLKIPPTVGTYGLVIAVYRPAGKDLSRTFAKCELTFDTIDSERTGSTPIGLVPGQSAPQFHLYFSETYIEKSVTASLQRKELIANESCVEGYIVTKADVTPLDRHFTLQLNSGLSRVLSFARAKPLPRYSVLAHDRSNTEPQDTLPDLPPQARPVPGITPTSPAGTLSEPAAPRAPSPTLVADAASPSPSPSPPTAFQGPAPAPMAPAAPDTAATTKSRTLTEQVDAYVRGEDHDRTQLYQSWSDVANYVARGLRDESAKDSNLVARHLNLISNALNVIAEGKYLPPTLRPNWDDSVKPDRLLKSQDIPGFAPNDYKIVVDSLCSTDEDVRRAAQRLLKLYPSSHFYSHLQALSKQPNLAKCRPSFIAETAAYYFYNRIVEYDGTFTLDKQSSAWIRENYAEGSEWTKRGEAQDSSLGAFSAMLDYARGLVMLDHGEKNEATESFNRMIDSLRSSGRIYPSNPQHIATALKLIYDPGRSSKLVRGAVVFNPPDRRSVAKAYVTTESSVILFAAPDSPKQIGKMKSDAIAHVYLRLDNWDLLEAGGQIGWARRVITSAAK
jgi:hypothetical protein